MKKKIEIALVLVIFFFIFLFLTITSITQKTYTVCEPVYLFNGYMYLKTGNSFQFGHPILVGAIGALPLLFANVSIPKFEEIKHVVNFARKDFLYYKTNNPEKLIFISRLPFIFISFLFALFVFKWAKELYGLKAGFLALSFYIFNPLIIGNSRLVLTDLPVAGFMFISLYFFWKFMLKKRVKHLCLCSIFFGLSISTKTTGIFLLPILFLVYLLFNYKEFKIKNFILSFLTITILGIMTFALIHIKEVHPIYTFDDPFYLNAKEYRSKERLNDLLAQFVTNKFVKEKLIFLLTKIPVPGPHSIQAYFSQILHSKKGHAQFFLGEYTSHGKWYYYLIAYLIETPIPLIIMFLFSILFFKKLKNKELKNEIFLILPSLAWLLIFSFIVRLNLGLRHVLFSNLLFFVFISKIGKFKEKILKLTIYILLLFYIFSALLVHPDYLAYFNQFVGGPINGYKYEIEFDYGQDIKRLGFYLEDHNISFIKLRYAGFAKPEYYRINYSYLTCKPQTGLIGISISALQGSFWTEGIQERDLKCFEWLRKMKPIDNIGYTIFIYNVTEKDLKKLNLKQ